MGGFTRTSQGAVWAEGRTSTYGSSQMRYSAVVLYNNVCRTAYGGYLSHEHKNDVDMPQCIELRLTIGLKNILPTKVYMMMHLRVQR